MSGSDLSTSPIMWLREGVPADGLDRAGAWLAPLSQLFIEDEP